MTLSEDVDLEEFVMAKDDLSGADIKAVCTEAGLLALRERRMKVSKTHFQRLLKTRAVITNKTTNTNSNHNCRLRKTILSRPKRVPSTAKRATFPKAFTCRSTPLEGQENNNKSKSFHYPMNHSFT